jgi:carboxypeptidase D
MVPVKNPYSWNNLANMLYVEQPVGVGFSQGSPDIEDEIGLSAQFLGFYRNFVDAFQVQNRKVYVTGESYGRLRPRMYQGCF